VVNFVGPRHLIELTAPAMPPGSAIAYVASSIRGAWQQNLASFLTLVVTDGFDAGKAWVRSQPWNHRQGHVLPFERGRQRLDGLAVVELDPRARRPHQLHETRDQ